MTFIIKLRIILIWIHLHKLPLLQILTNNQTSQNIEWLKKTLYLSKTFTPLALLKVVKFFFSKADNKIPSLWSDWQEDDKEEADKKVTKGKELETSL